jgi:hypothetical protein
MNQKTAKLIRKSFLNSTELSPKSKSFKQAYRFLKQEYLSKNPTDRAKFKQHCREQL